MKKILMLVLFLILLCPFSAEAKNNRQIVAQLTHHKPIKIVEFRSKKGDYIISHRKNKKYVVVEKIVTFSNGKNGGWTKDGRYFMKYNKRVPRNRKVVSYIIYSTTSNKFDDILWVVDNKKFR